MVILQKPSRTRRALLMSIALASFTALAHAEETASKQTSRSWSAYDLGTLGGQNSIAYGINQRAHVVGFAETAAAETHAFVWDGTMHDLGTLGGPYSLAQGINNRGQIVGAATTVEEPNIGTAVLWDRGKIYALPQLPGYWGSGAIDINDHAQIIGFSYPDGLIWERGTVRTLGSLGGVGTNPSAINERGQVVGSSLLADGNTAHAFLWQDGVMRDLGTLGGQLSVATGINDRGQIVGYSQTASGAYHAFLWERGVMTDLSTAAAGSTLAWDIANSGWLGGESTRPEGGPATAFMLRNGVAFILPHLNEVGATVYAVNQRGEAAGVGYVGLTSHAVLWR